MDKQDHCICAYLAYECDCIPKAKPKVTPKAKPIIVPEEEEDE